jgi:predicted enzyme related to lactoylglutathione lyase
MTVRKHPISVSRMYFQVMVKDIERAKKFYEDVFNLEMAFAAPPEIGWCELQLPGGAPRLGLNLADEAEYKPEFGRLMMEVEDIEGTKAYLESKGVETTEYTDIPCIVSYFYMKDSEGNTIQIVSQPRINE